MLTVLLLAACQSGPETAPDPARFLAPLLLGFILGGMMEDNLRRALLINDESLSFLWERPITLSIMLITLLVLVAPLFQRTIKKIFHIDSPDGLTID